MTTQVSLCCSRSSRPSLSRRLKAQAKYRVKRSLTLSCRSLGYSVGWVRYSIVLNSNVQYLISVNSFVLGCHALGLDLVKHWSFDRIPAERLLPSPSSPPSSSLFGETERRENGVTNGTARPAPSNRRSFLGLKAAHRRSLIIDMEVPSLPPSVAGTPVPSSPVRASLTNGNGPAAIVPSPPIVNPENMARQAGLGSLMKSAKRDVHVPEFDMSAFF